jgi:hypothetical protein
MIEQIDIALVYPFALMRALKTPPLPIAKQATDHGTDDGAIGDAGEQRPKRGHIELIRIGRNIVKKVRERTKQRMPNIGETAAGSVSAVAITSAQKYSFCQPFRRTSFRQLGDGGGDALGFKIYPKK